MRFLSSELPDEEEEPEPSSSLLLLLSEPLEEELDQEPSFSEPLLEAFFFKGIFAGEDFFYGDFCCIFLIGV